MRWHPTKPTRDWKWFLPLFRPIILDDNTHILWEWIQYRLIITREWGGMGADGFEGYYEYRDGPLGDVIGQVSVTN